MKKTKFSTPEPVEHIDPERLAFYESWERSYLKIPNPLKKSKDLWRSLLSEIGGLSLISLLKKGF